MAQVTTPFASPPVPRARQYALFGVLLTAFAGIVLAWWHPLWLKPENFVYTPFVYAAIALLWIPVLVVLAVIPATRFRFNRLRVVIFIVVLLVALGTAAVNFLMGTLMSGQGLRIAAKTYNCVKRPVANGHGADVMRWTCLGVGLMDTAPILIFEGYDGDLFVRLVESFSCFNLECQNYP
jgi:hypothetical protein